jgi:hypothetical protein
VEDLEQRLDHVVGAEERETFDRPVADVHVGVLQTACDDLEGALWLDATVAEQADVPQGVRTRTLPTEPSVNLEAIDGRRLARQTSGRDVHLDRRRAHAHVVRIDRHPEE